ncbi:MAG: phenylacetate--CoA ligase [marine bacterium B5-7]|nr:MAG: phenylacetate--CoA ligase [marine bacterium B5-7]
MNDTRFYDARETRDPEQRESELFTRLAEHVAHARDNTKAYGLILAHIDPREVTDRDSLATLPLTRKSDLVERQRQDPPFGDLVAAPRESWQKIFASPGPIFEPQISRPNYWRLARALFAAGFRAGQIIHNTYSYHLTPAGSMLESGAFALGCGVIPGGVGQTEQQIDVIEAIKPDGYVGTPSFLHILLNRADSLGRDLSCIKQASVSGEALPESLRKELGERGIKIFQTYATADVGLIAYETHALDGMIMDEDVILEIVQPGSGQPLSPGQVGEVVVTVLNPDYPLIRFATGDLSAIMPGVSPCGRTNQRIKGWMGRADQTTKVRGMFIRPEQVNEVAARHESVKQFRLLVSNEDQQDVVILRCFVENPDESLESSLIDTIRELCKVRAGVEFVDADSLPNDGKVIEDVREYD